MLAISRGLCLGRWRAIPALLLLPLLPIRAAENSDDARTGLILSISVPGGEAGRTSDTSVTPNVKLFVPAGKPVTPFVSPGKFEAVWTGTLSMELRSDYAFQAEVNGKVKIEIGGQIVLEGTGTGPGITPGKLVRLTKGKNPVKITYSSPDRGDALIRLYWSDKPDKYVPFDLVPDAVWNHDGDTPALSQARAWRHGREIMLDYRCFKCHETGQSRGVPEMGMDAPSFESIGSRRRVDWICEWVLDPRAIRPTARMPKVLHGPKSREQAAAIAIYLASLKVIGAGPGAPETQADQDQIAAGEKLFTTLNCAGCHTSPDAPQEDASKIPLKQAARKFTSRGALASFLREPETHYAWIRMPNFRFTADEAASVAAYLLSTAQKPSDDALKPSGEQTAEGRRLVQSSGCLNCHGLKEENKFPAMKLSGLVHWDQGCLAPAPKEDATAPQFVFTDQERSAIQAFVQSPPFLYSLQTHVPTEFTERQTRLLNCRACHGAIEGFPAFESLGGRLRPEWMKSFLAGEVSYKPRHWLPARMPAFKSRAGDLAAGLVMQHGMAPVSPEEPPVNMELASVGRKLISINGGFSCVQCHSVNKAPAIQVFESEGINLGYSAQRLQTAYFYRWVRNPTGIDPLTKMPKFFAEDDKSPLTEILGGDIQKQLDAVWNYLRLGDKMPPPPGPDAP